MYRWAEDVGPMVGLSCRRHFVGFFNVPVQAPTPANLFTVIPRNCPISVAFTARMGMRRTYSHLQPRGLQGGLYCALCRVELVVQFPARGSTQALLCLFPGVLLL